MKLMSAAPLIFLALNSHAKDFKFCSESINETYGISDVRMDNSKPNKIIDKSGNWETTYEFSRDGEILSIKSVRPNWTDSIVKFVWNSGRIESYASYKIQRDKSKSKIELKQSWIVKFDYGSNGHPYKKTEIDNEMNLQTVTYSYRKSVSDGGYKDYCVSNRNGTDYSYWSSFGNINEKGFLYNAPSKFDPSQANEEAIYFYLKNADYKKASVFKREYIDGKLNSIYHFYGNGEPAKTWYGDDGFKISESFVKGDGVLKKILFKYELDDKGNWIKMSTYDLVFSGFSGGEEYKPVLSEEKTRSISYFD